MGTIVRCLLNLPTAAEDKLGARHYTLAAALIAILSAYCLAYERSIFGLSATMAIIAFFALVTGRLLFPAVLVATTASTIVSISAVKHSILQVAFMLPDIILVANPGCSWGCRNERISPEGGTCFRRLSVLSLRAWRAIS